MHGMLAAILLCAQPQSQATTQPASQPANEPANEPASGATPDATSIPSSAAVLLYLAEFSQTQQEALNLAEQEQAIGDPIDTSNVLPRDALLEDLK
jgi:hypothetical protein